MHPGSSVASATGGGCFLSRPCLIEFGGLFVSVYSLLGSHCDSMYRYIVVGSDVGVGRVNDVHFDL